MEKSEKSEQFVLDARLTEMISISAFRATLRNGHELVAYMPRSQRDVTQTHLKAGDAVRVRMSPFDMSRGQVVLDQGTE